MSIFHLTLQVVAKLAFVLFSGFGILIKLNLLIAVMGE